MGKKLPKSPWHYLKPPPLSTHELTVINHVFGNGEFNFTSHTQNLLITARPEIEPDKIKPAHHSTIKRNSRTNDLNLVQVTNIRIGISIIQF